MLGSLRRLAVGAHKNKPVTRRRLGVEVLEPRTLLSAASMTAPVLRGEPAPCDVCPAPDDVDIARVLMEATSEPLHAMWPAIETRRPPRPVAAPALGRPTDVRVAGEAEAGRLAMPSAVTMAASPVPLPADVRSVLSGPSIIGQWIEDHEDSHRIGLDASRTIPEPEGGFIDTARFSAETGNHLGDQVFDARELAPRAGMLPPVDPWMAPREFDTPQMAWLHPSASARQEAAVGRLALGSLEVSRDADSLSQGGETSLPAYEWIAWMDSGMESAARERARLAPSLGFEQSAAIDVVELAPRLEPALNDPVLSSPGVVDRPRRFGVEVEAEGGLVDIDGAADAASESFELARPRWTRDTFWHREEQDPGDSLVEDQDGENEALAGDPAAARQSAESVQSGRAAQRLGLPIESDEGGMIELVAAVVTATEPTHTAKVLPRSDDQHPSHPGGSIRMDSGVALFQAFELATVPTQHVHPSGSSSEQSGETGLPAGSPPATSTLDGTPAQESLSTSGTSEEQPEGRHSAASLVVVASLVVAVDRLRQEEDPTHGECRDSARFEVARADG